MKKLLLVLFLLAALIVPATADPTGGFLWQGHQDIFFWNQSSTTVPGYYIMDHIPQLRDETSITKTVTKNAPVTFGNWILPVGSPLTNQPYTIAPGIWAFHIYASSSNPAGTDRFSMYLLNRSASGVETNIWPNLALSEDITAGDNEYFWEYVRRNFTYMNPGDRLVIRINATTTTTTTDMSIRLAGNARASRLSSSYWLSPVNVFPGTNASNNYQFANSGGVPITIWMVVVLIAFALFIAAFTYRLRTATGDINRERVMFSAIGMVVSLVAAYLSLCIDVPTGEIGILTMHTLYQIGALPWVFGIMTLLCLVNVVYSLMMPELVKPEQAESKFGRDENEDLYSDGGEEE